MEVISLSGEVRKLDGKGALSTLRNNQQVPGILYRNIDQNVPCALNLRELNAKIKFPIRRNQLYRLTLGKDTFLVFVKDWQLDPLRTHQWKHVDFFVIDEKEKVRVSVPLAFTGKFKGLLNGGILQPLVREIEVDALPNHIPEKIEVAVDDLDVGENIHINDLTPPPECQFHAPTNYALVTVAVPSEEEEVKSVVEEEGEVPAEGEAKTEEPEKA